MQLLGDVKGVNLVVDGGIGTGVFMFGCLLHPHEGFGCYVL